MTAHDLVDPRQLPFDHVDHIGVAVHDADAAVAHYTGTFGFRVISDEVAEDPGVRLIYLDAGNTMIQLVSPVRASLVADWLAAHGEGLHHLCFRVENIPGTLRAWADDDAAVFMGGRGRRACFLTGQHHGVNIELTERDPLPAIQVVLDDDPTGSQCAQGIDVALDLSADTIEPLVRRGEPFFVVTNIRALPAAEAATVLREIRERLLRAAAPTRRRISLIVRGDSTLRGHLATEVAELGDPDGVVVLVPAFPAADRVTTAGVHHVRVGGAWLNSADTEFARDSQFGYTDRDLVGYVRRHLPGRLVLTCAPERLSAVLAGAPAGAVVVPDVVHDGDVQTVATGIREAERHRDLLVRAASPLAAVLTNSKAPALLPDAPAPEAGTGLLVVCGSHTLASTRQLARIASLDRPAVELDTDATLNGSAAVAVQSAVEQLRTDLGRHGMAVLSTARIRHEAHQDLASGARLMDALTATVAQVRSSTRAVIVKGGISSLQVARDGLGVATVTVLGQLETGVSLWRLNGAPADLATDLPVVSVPGNVGDDEILWRLAKQLGFASVLPDGGAAVIEDWKDAVK
jgi:methylmalonyl-CoA epimerase